MKKAMITGLALILVGILIVVGGLFTMNYDLSRFQTEVDDRIFTVSEDFSDILVEAGDANVVFALSPDSQCRVTTKDYKNITTTALVDQDTLTIRREDNRKWYQRVGIFFGEQTITVQLPQGAWQDLNIDGSVGDVTIPEAFTFENVRVKVSTGRISVGSQVGRDLNLAVTTGDIAVRNTAPGNAVLSTSTGKITCEDLQILGDLHLSVTTGDISLKQITCRDLTGEASTGDVRMTDVVCSGQMKLETTTGDIKFTACDAASLDLQCSTGDIQGTLLTGKLFAAQTSTGKVRIPASIPGGSCKLKTTTGDIQITVS